MEEKDFKFSDAFKISSKDFNMNTPPEEKVLIWAPTNPQNINNSVKESYQTALTGILNAHGVPANRLGIRNNTPTLMTTGKHSGYKPTL